MQDRLYRRGKDDRLRLVLTGSQPTAILQELHKGNAGGHFSYDITVRKILDAGYLWPTLYQDTVRYCQSCHDCQMSGGLPKPVSTKLLTQLPAEPFMKWGLDFIGPVVKTRHTGCRYILVATDYATKWIEARALRGNTAKETAKFLYEAILTRFGCPLQLVSDQGSHFLNKTIQNLTDHFLLRHTTSTTYYPQSNGQAESTNKVIVRMLQKLVDFTPRRVLTARLTDLEKLDETRHSAAIHQGVKQWNRAQWVQTQGPKLQFNVGDHVLWHPKSANLHAGKLRGKWFGPYRVQYVLPNNTVLLVSIQHFDPDPVIVNVGKLKPYHVAEDLKSTDLPEPALSKSDIKNLTLRNEDQLPSTRPVPADLTTYDGPDSITSTHQSHPLAPNDRSKNPSGHKTVD